MAIYEEWRARDKTTAHLIDRPIDPITHGHIINALEMLHLRDKASQYWQHHHLTEAKLNEPVPPETR